jgi:mRNA interferase MazF
MINNQPTIQAIKPQTFEVRRGDIFTANLEFIVGDNRIQKGYGRPIIIISNERCNANSPVVSAVTLTSKMSKHNLPTHVFLEKGYCGLISDSIVLAEQIISIDKKYLLKHMGHCETKEMEKIEDALDVQLQRSRQTRVNDFPVPQKHQVEAFDITRVQIIKRGIESLERVLMENSINNITNILNDIQGLVNELKNYCDKFNVNYSLYYKSRLHAINNEKIRMCI